MPDLLYVTWTMDCEGIQELSTATGGPATWELSERAMRGYVDSLASHGHRATLFLTPLVAEQQAAVVRDLRDQGAEPGMHLHPQTADFGLDRHLGQLVDDMQELLLREGQARVAEAVGTAPTSFRPGCFSASDDTYPILADLGFTAGSVSLPGRNLPEVGAVWPGAEPFAHWADGDHRCRTGDLPFLEMPSCVDLADVERGPHVTGDACHLRLEREGILDWGPAILREHVLRQLELDWWLKSIVIMTHNTREYGSEEEPARQALECLVGALEDMATEFGLQIRPATLGEIRAAAPTPGR